MTKPPVFAVAGGIFALVIAMGIGRFAYTPILPLMQHDVLFSHAAAGYLASSNYAGYLLGAMVAGMTPRHRRTSFFRVSLLLSIITTAFMGLWESYILWFTWRLLSGIASAYVFVLASSIVLDQLAAKGKTNWSGLFYGGVGLGIFYTGAIVPVLSQSYGWKGAWIGLAATSFILAFVVWAWLREEAPTRELTRKQVSSIEAPSRKWFSWLVAAYGCEGLGYIVTGTFIVSIAETLPGMKGAAAWVWMLVGIGAIPSCIIWSTLGKKGGMVRWLIFAMILQSFGIVVPVLWMTPTGFAIGALIFGGTFMGITTLATMVARQIHPDNSSRAIGFLTAVYALGQMIGPTAAGLLTTYTQHYQEALIGAAGFVALGACLLWIGLQLEKKPVGGENRDRAVQ